MKVRRFDNYEEFLIAAVDLLKTYMQEDRAQPYAVMLTGGDTPLPIYEEITNNPFSIPESLRVVFSDERMVPVSSPDSNFGNAASVLTKLGMGEERILRVDTSLSVEGAAEAYDRELASFVENGGKIGLAILGLGSDGHVASMFTQEDLERGRRRYAMAVPRREGHDRVSVSVDLLLRVERIIFLVAGAEKCGIIDRLISEPNALIAGQALYGHWNVELWHTEESRKT